MLFLKDIMRFGDLCTEMERVVLMDDCRHICSTMFTSTRTYTQILVDGTQVDTYHHEPKIKRHPKHL